MYRFVITLLLLVPLSVSCNLDDENTSLLPQEPEPDLGMVEECEADELLCDEQCVAADTSENCGDCGVVCGAEEACVAGTCELQCADGEVICEGACVNPQTSAQYCGATDDCQAENAGITCDAGDSCVAGMCQCTTEDPGFAISTASGVATEGGDPVTYTLVLTEEPCHPVTVEITTDDQVEASADSLTFSVDTWDQVQTVSVAAVLDAAREMDHTSTVTHAVVSEDPAYDGLALDSVVVDIANTAPVRQVVVAADGSEPDGHSFTPVVSDDGRYVVFLSQATNLTADTISDSTLRQVYWRDLETGETRLISKGANGPGDGDSSFPQLSEDGQVVAFTSTSTNLTTATADSGSNEVFVYTAADDTLSQISDTCDTCASRSFSANISLSADGERVAFTTRRQLLPQDESNELSVYTYDRSSQTLTLASLNENDEYPVFYWGNNVFTPRLSANGTYVGFSSAGRNFVPSPDITEQNFHAYFKNLDTKAVRRVSSVDDMQNPCDGAYRATGSQSPFVSDDGTLALFQTLCPMDESSLSYANTQVYVWDDNAGQNTRITRGSDGLPDGPTVTFGYSSDGSYGLLASLATNLLVEEGPTLTEAIWTLYVYEESTGNLRAVNFGADYRWSNFGLAYRNGDAKDSDSPSFAASMSKDGQHVVFATVDDMLSPESATPMTYANIYVVTLF